MLWTQTAITNGITVWQLPSVFINGEYFGGGRVIKDLNREGKLVDVFKKALQNVTISAGDK